MSQHRALSAHMQLRQDTKHEHKRDVKTPEDKLITQEHQSHKEIPYEPEYLEVQHNMGLYDPALGRGDKNPTNDPAHAVRLAWANLPWLMTNDRQQGPRDDQGYKLRTVPTECFGPPNFNLASLPDSKVVQDPRPMPKGLLHISPFQ